jgi:hypothetical protein
MTEAKNRITPSMSAAGALITRKNGWVGVCAESPDEAHYKRLLNVHACSVHIVHDAADLHEPGLLGVVFDAGLRGWRRDALFTMVATGVPVVVGPQTPRAVYQLVWDMKPGIEAAGGIFEIATDKSDFKCRLNAVVRAALLRSTHHENFAQALLGYSTELPSALEAAWVPSSRHGMSQFWQALRTYLEHKRAEPALTTLPGVKAAVHDLRNPVSGRLDGELIRICFGLKRTELAKLLDVTPEALRQTPDSPKHREKFEVLEQVAALRTLLANPADFAKWLESPNTELESNTPISLIREGRAAVVADLVQDILTNRGD